MYAQLCDQLTALRSPVGSCEVYLLRDREHTGASMIVVEDCQRQQQARQQVRGQLGVQYLTRLVRMRQAPWTHRSNTFVALLKSTCHS